VSVLVGNHHVAQGSKSTRRNRSVAISATFPLLLFFAMWTAFPASAATPSGPPAPGRATALATQTPASCQPGDPDCSSATGEPAPAPSPAPTPSPGPPKPTKPKPGTDSPSGGTAPGPGGAAPGSGGNASPAREPQFIEEDPSLSGGVSPSDTGDIPADPLAASPLTVPNFLINNFEIPPFLLPIYQACGSEYGIPWQVLAAINRIETAFGTNVNTSYAGAMGWMQFMPGTWAAYGVDANGDGKKDPYNPVDAICAAANYLSASGYAEDPRAGIFSYNHAEWYVDDILTHAAAYAQIPPEMISALTGLTEGARFPVAAEADYDGKVSTKAARRNGTDSQDVSSDGKRTSIEIEAEGGAPVIAVNDAVVKAIDRNAGTVVIEDAYGNRYSYAGLGSIASVHPVPRRDGRSGSGSAGTENKAPETAPAPDGDLDMGLAKAADEHDGEKAKSDPQAKVEGSGSEQQTSSAGEISEVLTDPEASADAAATASEVDSGSNDEPTLAAAEDRRAEQATIAAEMDTVETGTDTENARGRVYANPLRPQNQQRATVEGQSVDGPGPAGVDGKPGDYVIYDGSASGIYRFDSESTDLRPLRKGSKVIAGTVLGRLAEQPVASITFSIQPGGKDTPQIDPKPFLDGWMLLAETNIYNANGKNRFADRLGVGGVLLLSKPALQRRVLADPKIGLGECDREDVANGSIDRRILATLSFLSEKGYELLITSLYCGRESSITTSGYVSNHSHGAAVDIAAINGQVVTSSTQGPGSLTDIVAREVLSLQGTMTPDEVISLLDYPQVAGFALSDHDDHLHVGFRPAGETALVGGSIEATLGASQWRRLTERLGEISNPEISAGPPRNVARTDRPDKGSQN
jgi:hypothetical protein